MEHMNDETIKDLWKRFYAMVVSGEDLEYNSLREACQVIPQLCKRLLKAQKTIYIQTRVLKQQKEKIRDLLVKNDLKARDIQDMKRADKERKAKVAAAAQQLSPMINAIKERTLKKPEKDFVKACDVMGADSLQGGKDG